MAPLQTAIYQHLIKHPSLTMHLGKSTINPNLPSIYDEWAPENTPMPYMNLTYSYAEGFHFSKIDATLNVDIFTQKDSVLAETIRNETLFALDRIKLFPENESMIRVHYRADSIIFEPEQDTTHWNIEFDVYYWRKEMIRHYQNN